VQPSTIGFCGYAGGALLAAKFAVRKEEAPFDLVIDETTALHAASRERLRNLDPAKVAKFINAVDKFAQSGKEKPTN
jgi:hypothetical protein